MEEVTEEARKRQTSLKRKDGCGLSKSLEELGGKLKGFVPEGHN